MLNDDIRKKNQSKKITKLKINYIIKINSNRKKEEDGIIKKSILKIILDYINNNYKNND
jgi:hypothetical protein